MITISPSLLLRPITEEDAEELFILSDENRKHLRAFLAWIDSVHEVADTKEFIKQISSNQESIYDGKFAQGIELNGKLIGVIDFHNGNSTHKSLEIGYWLAKEHNGQGIMTKACAAMIKYAFDNSDANRILLSCVTNNFKSQAVAERLNFTKEGVERQARFFGGQFVDVNRNSLLRHEWNDQGTLAKVLSS